jgi:hypothetical protein
VVVGALAAPAAARAHAPALPRHEVGPTTITPSLRAWASTTHGSDLALALYARILQLKHRGVLHSDRDNRPQARFGRGASELVAAIEAGQRQIPVSCYELSLLFVTSARVLGLQARGFEVQNPIGTGQIGHVVAGVSTQAQTRLFDLQNETTQIPFAVEPLAEPAFIAHHHNHRAVAHSLRGESRAALDAIDRALALAPDRPKTLSVRLERQSANAQVIAEFLESHPKVTAVRYPGLESFPQHALAKQQATGFGAMLWFEVEGGVKAGKKLMDSVKLCTLAENLGSVETLITHPVTMTHADVEPAERKRVGITDGLVRLSVGLEDVEDLIADLRAALSNL